MVKNSVLAEEVYSAGQIGKMKLDKRMNSYAAIRTLIYTGRLKAKVLGQGRATRMYV